MVMLAFETMNNVRLEVRLQRIDVGHRSDLQVTMLAHQRGVEIGDRPPLASVSVTCSDMNLKTLDSAVLASLYRLDFQLAEREFASATKPKA